MIQESEDEGKWVFPSRINADERYEALAIVEAAARQGFLVQSLQVAFSEQDDVPLSGSTSDSPSR